MLHMLYILYYLIVKSILLLRIAYSYFSGYSTKAVNLFISIFYSVSIRSVSFPLSHMFIISGGSAPGAVVDDEEVYRLHRYRLGVGEGPLEHIPDKALPLECNLVQLNGGINVTSTSHYTATMLIVTLRAMRIIRQGYAHSTILTNCFN